MRWAVTFARLGERSDGGDQIGDPAPCTALGAIGADTGAVLVQIPPDIPAALRPDSKRDPVTRPLLSLHAVAHLAAHVGGKVGRIGRRERRRLDGSGEIHGGCPFGSPVPEGAGVPFGWYRP